MDSFKTKKTANFAGQETTYYSLRALEEQGYDISRLPFAHKILLENMLRNEDGKSVRKSDIEAVLNWDPNAEPENEVQFVPGRVLLQDFTGVPCVVDLATMRDAVAELGGEASQINPLQPVELVIDHSVQVDAYGSDAALMINLDLEYERNAERYEFLKWGQTALDNFKAVPPNTGICHQVNLEYLARGVMEQDGVSSFDTLVGTDSHTTMINGLGVLGWGVGGIEAEAAMLGQPVSMLLPQVVGFRLEGKLKEGCTATDLVLTVTEMLRKHGVVGKFVEFFGPGIASMPLADRATIANMAPEYGATCGLFCIDDETIRFLEVSGRPERTVKLVREYCEAQGTFGTESKATYSSTLTLDLATVEPSIAGPKRPQDRVSLGGAKTSFATAFPGEVVSHGDSDTISDLSAGDIVIAAITSCTNTSNPSVMVAAGLVAKKAAALGLKPKPWVKTSLAPGSRVVTEYLRSAGLLSELEKVGFNVVGYGCTTCIGNSGPLPAEVSAQIAEKNLAVVSVLSGNRNFEGRVNLEVKANYLMSPPLVVAYAFAGSIHVDLTKDVIATTPDGKEVRLADLWPTQAEIAALVRTHITREMFTKSYATVFDGDEKWKAIDPGAGERFSWKDDSTYVRKAPYFDGMSKEAPSAVSELAGLRALAVLGDSITTDHISPAGSIKANQPAGKYLSDHGVPNHLFNSYGSRRGNHEVMIRGTFANVRLKNQLAPGTDGGFTTNLLNGEVTTIFEASEAYQAAGIGLVILAGKEYGTGSSRDWAAKGTRLLGVRAVLAESFERIHRSNLVGMGVLPMVYANGATAASLGLTGTETFDLVGFAAAHASGFAGGKQLTMKATATDGKVTEFPVIVRLDTATELEYYRHGGVLQFVLRSLLR